MKRLLENIRTRFRRWLGIVEVERENAVLRAELEALRSAIFVGVDLSPSKYDRSWAVVCSRKKGRMSGNEQHFVEFVDLSDADGVAVSKWLSNFKRDNMTVDAPSGMSQFKYMGR